MHCLLHHIPLLLLLAVPATTNPSSHTLPPIFEDEDGVHNYQIKSCLSPDLEEYEQSTCRFYAIMIDAGSTGTRLHLFEFSHDITKPASPFKLEREIFQEEKPGLSSYEDNPQGAAESVGRLIDKAHASVPSNMWAHTPIELKATAGLRLLPELSAEAILDHVERVLLKSQFLTSPQSAAVMTGTDEGIFGWFTLNFLLDRIDAVKIDPAVLLKNNSTAANWTAAAMDLGGGSTQVTFRPLHQITLQNAPRDFTKTLRVFGENISLYTHSYLGNGLMAARLGTLQMNERPVGTAATKHDLYTSCLPHGFAQKWHYNGQDYTIHGKRTYNFDACLKETQRFVRHSNIDGPDELGSRDLYLFGYYFDRGLQVDLVPPEGGFTTVGDFARAARSLCLRTASQFGTEHWSPWLCQDVTYIYAFLGSDGLSLDDDKTLFLAKKIRGMETSWSLGAAYHLLNTYHEERRNAIAKSAYSRLAASMCGKVCARFYTGLTSVLSFFQIIA